MTETFFSYRDGVYARNPTPLKLCIGTHFDTYADKKEAAKQFAKCCKEVYKCLAEQEKTSGNVTTIKYYCEKGFIRIVNIGGRHSTHAYKRLIVSKPNDFPSDFSMMVSIWRDDLSDEEYTFLGRHDNLVKAGAVEKSHDRVFKIREYFKKTYKLDGSAVSVTAHDIDYCLQNYIVPPGQWANLTLSQKKNKKQSFRTLLKGALWPDRLDNLMTGNLVSGRLTEQMLDKIFYHRFDLGALEEQLKLLHTMKITPKIFKYNLDLMKADFILQPSVKALYNSKGQAFKNRPDFPKFYRQFTLLYPLAYMLRTFPKELNFRRLKDKVDVNDPNSWIFEKTLLKEQVMKCFKFFEAPNENSDIITSKFYDFTNSHYFHETDILLFLQKQEEGKLQLPFKIELVFIDPPFGCLEEEWDVAWDEQTITTVLEKLDFIEDAPIFIFVDHRNIHRYLNVITQLKMQYDLFSWLKPSNPSTFGALNYACNFIIVARRSENLKYVSRTQADEIPPLTTLSFGNNFIHCPTPPSKFLVHNRVVNPTQKPLEVLRAFIYNHVSRDSCILDICSGSGSGALAAASLGCNSISVDKRPDQISSSKQRLREFVEREGALHLPHPQSVFSVENFRKPTRKESLQMSAEISASQPVTMIEKSNRKNAKKPKARASVPVASTSNRKKSGKLGKSGKSISPKVAKDDLRRSSLPTRQESSSLPQSSSEAVGIDISDEVEIQQDLENESAVVADNQQDLENESADNSVDTDDSENNASFEPHETTSIELKVHNPAEEQLDQTPSEGT